MVLSKLSDFVGSDVTPAIGVVVGAGLSSAFAGFVIDQLKWSGTDKATLASVALKLVAGAGLFAYSQGLTDKTSMQFILSRGAALGSLVGIGITLWNRFAPFQLQVRADSSLLSVEPAIIGQRQTRPIPVRVGQGSGCGGNGSSGIKVSTIGKATATG